MKKSVFIIWNGKKSNWMAIIILLLYKKIGNVISVLCQCCNFLPTLIHHCHPFRMRTKIHKFSPTVCHHVFFSRDGRHSVRSFILPLFYWFRFAFFQIVFSHLKPFQWEEWNKGPSSAFPKIVSRSKGMEILDMRHMQIYLWIHSLLCEAEVYILSEYIFL